MGRLASLFWLLVGLGVSDGRIWTVLTKTGDRENADTNANVYLHLIDRNAKNSPGLHLDDFIRNDFQRGAFNSFMFDTVDFEDVCWIRIYRDNNGDSPGLFLEWVAVKNMQMLIFRNFTVNDWVPTEEVEWKNNFVKERTPPCNAGDMY